MTDRIEAAEEQIAHLTRMFDDLSDVVTRQADEIATLSRRVEMLMRREGEREAGSAPPPADQRPPHW